MSNLYRCASCREEFEKGRSDEEAMQESVALFGELPPEQLAIVCDDCFVAMQHLWNQ